METARYDAPYRNINNFIINFLADAPFVATRHENCTLMAEAYDVDYRWPLWDVRLVQQYLSTPSIEKVGPGGIGRYLHRRAIDEVVPKRVAWKPTKDMGYQKALRQTFLIDTGRDSAEIAKKEFNHLHPALDELIDREKMTHQISKAISNESKDTEFIFSFSKTVQLLSWLNHWLKS